MAQANPDFIEALCTAWVRGWYHGIDGVKTDDGKRTAAAEIASDPRFVKFNAHDGLVAALKKATSAIVVAQAHGFDCCGLLEEVEAALAKAQPKD